MITKKELKISDFKLAKILGIGPLGKVYQIEYEGKQCALKVIEIERMKRSNITNHMMFQMTCSSLFKHPLLLQMFASFKDKLNYYYIYELCPLDLLSVMRNSKMEEEEKKMKKEWSGLDLKQMKLYCAQVFLLMEYLHLKNACVDGLHPRNILVSGNDGMIRLKEMGVISTAKYTLWLSPENIKKGKYKSKESDLWNYGVLVYWLISEGKFPFNYTSIETMYSYMKKNRIGWPKNVTVDRDGKDLATKLLKFKPKKRLKLEKLAEHPFIREEVVEMRVVLNEMSWRTVTMKEEKERLKYVVECIDHRDLNFSIRFFAKEGKRELTNLKILFL